MTPTHPHNDDKLAKRVFDRITEEHLIPRPRWEFVFKNYFFWGLGVVAVAIGAIAFSAIIFEVQNADWQYAFVTHSDLFSFFLDAAPFLWVAVLALFVGIGYLNVRKTNHGYRYPLSIIALGAVLTSLALGSALYEKGFGSMVEEFAGNSLPFHRSIMTEQHSWWLAPAKGLLGGTVVASASDVSSFELRDFSDAVWHVDASDLRTPDLRTVARGGMVRIVGVPTTATSSFHACFVLPWETYGAGRGGPTPLPLALIASTSDRSHLVPRSDACKQTRPYAQLRELDDQDAL